MNKWGQMGAVNDHAMQKNEKSERYVKIYLVYVYVKHLI